jgi:ubiquinone/menaquinone biosynthesis C-methylase UbiE
VAERRRVEAVYADYAADPAKRRAWDAENPGNKAIRDEVAGAVLPLLPRDGIVADLGCGGGWWLARLAAAGVPASRLLGVELLEQRVAAARRRVPGLEVRQGDVRELPLADDSVAAATLFTVLSSLASDEDRRRAMSEARRVVLPGGPIIVWEPRLPTGNPETAHVSRALLRSAFDDVAFQSITVLPPVARRVSVRTYARLARIPLLRGHRLVIGQA